MLMQIVAGSTDWAVNPSRLMVSTESKLIRPPDSNYA